MNEQHLRIGFTGGGNMAQAIIRGLLRSGHRADRLYVADPSNSQRDTLKAIDGALNISARNADAARASRVLVLAVKPQVIQRVLGDIAGLQRPDGQLILSIAAGISIGLIQDLTGEHTPVVRVMPNQPALVNAGVSVLSASGTVSEEQKRWATYITAVVGQALWIDDESMIDAVTAVSGSGPAYFYLLMEIMEACAQQFGLPGGLAKALVRQTALGAGRAAAESDLSFSALRASVTSPGGTTEAATNLLEQAGIHDIFRKALTAARDRSIELGLK